MTDNEWLTVSEASKKINIPVETIRRYIRSHNVHLRVKKLGKKYFIHDESVTVHVTDELQEIRKELQEQRQFNEQQKEFNIQLLQELKNQRLFYEKKFDESKYDREFLGSLRNSMEQRRLESSGHEQVMNEQLENINQQLSEIKQNDNEDVKELAEHVSELSNQVEQIVKTIQEPAAVKEKKWWQVWK